MTAHDDDVTQAPTPGQVAERAAAVRERIRGAGGDPGTVTVVAVTKAHDVSYVRAALAAGLFDIGENYANELTGKHGALTGAELSQARFHFVGRLQRNKVRVLAPVVALWQTVDRVEVGQEIAKRAPGAAVLVQVNSTCEPNKGGCDPAFTPELVDRLRELGLDVRGLMTVGKVSDAAATAAAFARTARIADDLDLKERSMGMSDDIEIAVAEGTTMVRVGRDLFGPRSLSSPDRH